MLCGRVAAAPRGRMVAGQLVLGLDVGSSGTRGVLVDETGRTQATSAAPARHLAAAPRTGRAGCRARLVGRAPRQLTRQAGRRPQPRRRGRGRASAGWDRASWPADAEGRPLRPAILYGIDSRAAGADRAASAAVLGADGRSSRAAGRSSTSQSVGPKVRWVAEEEPQVWAATRRVFGADLATWSRASRASTSSTTTARVTGLRCTTRDAERRGSASGRRRAAPGLPSAPASCGRRRRAGRASARGGGGDGPRRRHPGRRRGTIDSWAEVAAAGLRGPGRRVCWSTGPACS